MGIRSTGIGGGDIGTILGLNPYKTRVELYYEKRGELPKFEGNEATEWGNLLEDIIARKYATVTGQKVKRVRQTIRRKDFPWMLARVDRRVLGAQEGKVLEVKTALSKRFNEANWEGAPPESYSYQVLWYMWVSGWDLGDLAALVSGPEFRIYNIERDENKIWRAVEGAKEFWARVLAGEPPEPVNENDCRIRWAIDSGESVIASAEIFEKVSEISKIQAQISELEAQESALKVMVKEFMQDKAFLLSPLGDKLATWKNSVEIDEERVKLEAPDAYAAAIEPRFSVSKFKKAYPLLAKDMKKPSETRVFRITV